LSYSGVVHEV